MRTLAGWCAAALGIGAQMLAQTGAAPEQTGLAPEVLLLARIKLHMMETLVRQPDYTCLETVERSRRDASTRKYRLEDTLRIEVALVDHKEMFAWPGSKQFEDKEIRELVPTGAFGTGDFALHARSVFGGNAASFEARGEEKLGGRDAVRFDFHVPRMLSGYTIRNQDTQAVVGYHGSFWVDPESLDALRLLVIADDLPPELKLRLVTDSMDYARATIGDGDFLLPESSEVVLVGVDGQESRNRLRFTACHQFAGQSVLSFDDPAAAPTAPAAKLELELPRGLDVALSLVDEIDTDTAAIGDPVRAQLHNDLKVKGRVLLPKGAMASGRISRLERHPNFTVLGLVFEELESSTMHARAEMKFDRLVGLDVLPAVRGWSPNTLPRDDEGLVALQSGRVRLRRGILMFWRT